MSLVTSLQLSSRASSLAIFFGLSLALGADLQAQNQSAQINTQTEVANRAGPVPFGEQGQVRISDPDLGNIDLVSRTARPKMFSFWTDQSVDYTSNAFLAQSHEQDAFYYNGRLDAAFVPYATRDFTPRLTFEQDFFRYDRFSRLDFDAQTVQIDIQYRLFHNDAWYVDGSYSLSRLYSPHGSVGQFYRYGLANLSLNNSLLLWHGKVQLLSALGGYSRHGIPSDFDRFGAYLNLAAVYQPVEKVQVSILLRPEAQFYTHDPVVSSRKDFDLSLGGGVTWTPIRYLSLNASVAFVGNYSNRGGQSYNVVTPAITLAAQISF